jgi:tetratricopeptide (TPR) repeat protein
MTLRTRNSLLLAGLLSLLLAASATQAQTPRKLPFRAVHYDIVASLLPVDQALTARAKVDFEAREASRMVEVELHPNLKLTAVLGPDGKPLSFERDENAPLLVRVTLAQPAAVGDKVSLTFDYAGPLANEENSPIKGVRLAVIGQESAYLLLPARWFPLTGYPSNRYTAVFSIEVPEGFTVAGTGKASGPTAASVRPVVAVPGKAPAAAPVAPSGPRSIFTFRDDTPEDSGSFVAGKLQRTPVQAEGLNFTVFTPATMTNLAAPHGEVLGRILNEFSSEFGSLPDPNLSLVWLPDGSVQGYTGPGLILLGHRQWDAHVNYRFLAQLAAHQWWGERVMPASPSDVWVTDGLARYSEGLYVEQLAGKEGFNRALEEFAVGALMYEDAAPIAQADRLEPFTSDYRSVVLNKGAMVFHMLRAQLGDAPFHDLLREFYAQYAGKTATLEDFKKLAQSRVQDKPEGAPNLTAFFAQWLNSTGIPEFKVEYVVYRTKKGFQIVGKVKQDLETFRMQVEMKVETEGNPEYKTIDVIGTDSDFTVDTFGRPKPGGITLDPNNNILKASNKLRVRAAIARGEEMAEVGRYYDAVQQYQRALTVQKNNSLAHFRIGEAFFFQKNYQAAANSFREAIDGDLDLSYKWVEVWSHIYLGKIFDISGQRERAVNEYSKAKQTNDDTGGAQAEVDKYLASPYKEEVVRSGNP